MTRRRRALLARPASAPAHEETLLDLCETPLAPVSGLASFTREPVSSLRDRLDRLRWRRLAELGERPSGDGCQRRKG